MQENTSNSVAPPMLFSEGLSRSFDMLAEAASRLFARATMTSYVSNNTFSNPKLTTSCNVLKENKAVVNIPLEDLIVKYRSPILGCSEDFPSSKAASNPFVSHGYVDLAYNSKDKSLRLAAHSSSLPKRASPLSPRSRPASPYGHLRPSRMPNAFSDNGYTGSSLQLIKWHWEYRYEHWKNSLRGSDVSFDNENPKTVTDFNPALFPRAGSLTRPLNHPESQALIYLDWALRRWSIDKVSRTLFLHDLSQRLASSSDPYPTDYPNSLNRPWECDWKMKWKIIEDAMLNECEQLRRYRDNTNDDFCVFDEDVVMKEIFGEDRMDVDGVCCVSE